MSASTCSAVTLGRRPRPPRSRVAARVRPLRSRARAAGVRATSPRARGDVESRTPRRDRFQAQPGMDERSLTSTEHAVDVRHLPLATGMVDRDPATPSGGATRGRSGSSRRPARAWRSVMRSSVHVWLNRSTASGGCAAASTVPASGSAIAGHRDRSAPHLCSAEPGPGAPATSRHHYWRGSSGAGCTTRWVVAAVTFIMLIGGRLPRDTGVLIVPLQHEFGWIRATISPPSRSTCCSSASSDPSRRR